MGPKKDGKNAIGGHGKGRKREDGLLRVQTEREGGGRWEVNAEKKVPEGGGGVRGGRVGQFNKGGKKGSCISAKAKKIQRKV